MEIEQRNVTVGELCEGYYNDAEEGVVGYGERLDIRPKYQREFVYKDAQRDEVFGTAELLVASFPWMTNIFITCLPTKSNRF